MRIAELVGLLAVATDVGTGLPDGHALRVAIASARLAELLGLDERTRADTYYVAMLFMAGCTAESHRSSEVLQDEIGIGTDTYGIDWSSGAEMFPIMMQRARAGRGPVDGVVSMMRVIARLPAAAEVGRAHCEVAQQMAESFGFDARFREIVHQGFERWDGKGQPKKLRGDAIALPVRVMSVATDAVIARHLGDEESALAVLRKRRKGRLDPSLVDAFEKHARDVFAAIDTLSPWQAAMDAEPGEHRVLDGPAIDECLRATGHFADFKSHYTHGHSDGVATRAQAAAKALKLSPDAVEATYRAGLLHDIGRVAVTTAIWDKAGPLSDDERERIRMHNYAGERILARVPSLARIAEIATTAHERLNGSGYHRRLPAAACPPEARVLAAADVYQALIEARPHRAAFSPDHAARELEAVAKRGELCPDAVGAVLGAAGHTVASPKRINGITDRELDVLRLLVRGLTNKEIASALDISTKTAGHHVQHVFEKFGVTTRAAATMIAMRAGIGPS